MKGFVISVILALLQTIAISAEEKLSASTLLALKRVAEENITTRAGTTTDTKPQYAGLYIVIRQGAEPQALEKYGAAVNMVTDSIVSVRMPIDSIYSLASDDIVKRIDLGYSPKPRMDFARESVLANKIIGGEDLPYPFNGDGVVIGIVDGYMRPLKCN